MILKTLGTVYFSESCSSSFGGLIQEEAAEALKLTGDDNENGLIDSIILNLDVLIMTKKQCSES